MQLCSFPSTTLLKKLSFPHCFACFIIDKLTISVWVYFWTLFSVVFIYISGFVTVPYCFDYCSFVELSEVRKCDTSSFVLFSQGCFDLHFLNSNRLNLMKEGFPTRPFAERVRCNLLLSTGWIAEAMFTFAFYL